MSRIPLTKEGEILIKEKLSNLKFVERPKISEAIAVTISGLFFSFKKINSSLSFSSPFDVIGSLVIYFHLAKGGNDIKIPSTFPPVCNPNFVPLSYSKLNSV